MFLKSTQPPNIDQHPYTFENLKQDNPNTCFPNTFLNSPDTNLAYYNVYAIADNPPQLTETQVIESKTPVYNSGLNRFEFEYVIRDKTTNEIRQEKYNPVQFMKDLLGNELFNQWTELIPTKQFIILITAFSNGSLDTVQSVYDQLKLAYSLPELAQEQWQQIADNNGISLTF